MMSPNNSVSDCDPAEGTEEPHSANVIYPGFTNTATPTETNLHITGKRTKQHTCETCDRVFSRREHLIRHGRTHTSERPFSCPHCDAAFPRSDIKQKHMKILHADQPSGQSASASTSEPSAKRLKPTRLERSKIACDQCRKRKLKCGDQVPCQSCVTKKLPCSISANSKRPGRPRATQPTHTAPPKSFVDHVLLESLFGALDSSGPSPPRSYDSDLAVGDKITRITVSATAEDGSSSNVQNHSFPEVSQASATTISEEPLGHGSTYLDDATLAIIQDPLLIEGNFPFEGNMYVDQDLSAIMESNWLLPPLGVENWLDDLDNLTFDNGIWLQSLPAPNADNISYSHMDNAVDILRHHFQQRSGTSSPNRKLWYSAPPSLSIYDKEVLNILLNIAQRNLSSTFKVFSNYQYNGDANYELCLAMAAVGGLFSTTPGSTAMAKSLYNDARRKHFERLFRKALPDSFESSLASIKTAILLEVYGLCSGDKRSYEFVEVFHYNTLEAMALASRQLCISRDGDAQAEELEHDRIKLGLVSEALEMLESYRVLLLLLPPCFPENFTPESSRAPGSNGNLHPRLSSPAASLAALMTPNGEITSCASLQTLTSITKYFWMSSPRGHECARKRYQLWNPEFIELALERWMTADKNNMSDPEETSTLDISPALLYHLALMHSYLNLAMILRYSHEFSKRSKIPSDSNLVESIHRCISGPDFKIARWHAEIMLQLIKKSTSIPYHLDRNHLAKERPQMVEPPHLPYCIYFATLVIWCAEAGVDVGGSGGNGNSKKESCIENGIQLLGMLKVRVSRVLGGALYEILSEEQRSPA